MSVLQMQRVSICAMKKDRKAILEDLQSLGVMEVDISIGEDETLKKMDTLEARQIFEKNASCAEQALEVLNEYAPEKTSMFAALEGKTLIEHEAYQDAVAKQKETLGTANKLLSLKKKIAEDHAAIIKLETQSEALVPWLDLDVPMNYTGTKSIRTLIGSIGSAMTLEEIYARVAEQAPDLEAIDIQIVSAGTDQTCIVAACMKEDAQSFEEALRTLGFAKPSQMIPAVPAQQREKLAQAMKTLQAQIEETQQQIMEYAASRGDLKLFADYYRMRAQKYEVLSQLPQSKQTFFISGYIAAKHAKALADRLNTKFELSVEIEDIPEEEEAPVVLANGKLGRTMEGVVGSFGLPAKGEIDPSSIMFFFYIFFFGLMLSDAAYGLIVFVACAVVLKKFPRMSEGMYKSISMFMWCGLSTIVWGILLGGYFGDLIGIVSKTFFGHEVTIAPLWFAPLDDPMKMLMFSMMFGLIHLFVGLGIKGYMCLRAGNYLDFLCDVVFWFMMLIGLIMMLLPSSLFRSISQWEIVFSPAVSTLAKGLAIAGAVGILLMSGRGTKNPGIRIALGAYDLYNITGWLSDVLSYSRLLALGLATGVIASVMNQMGSMGGKTVPGVILFIVVFIIGHTFNLGINILGAYVHTCRLQYVEFFGKFFEGGGREFNPFKANTSYVDIKEDTKL